ncbi:sensor histidine kinase [Candidatus Magnetobacterium casense]|uniref:histidine kinase n=1 Tax=Candidatus Magnetobacterium casense TaxID=1455061 RepID=A0ABS6RUR7_9BACT|nr:HAMP domain-containing sensor histidine kinase [Candidatus Magnetobacterium casensis]MBV6340192.1 HAMP domain-containing histidine kinase [Candidatus Magnetobacterium casensis]
MSKKDKQLADYAMVCDLICQLSAHVSEAATIDNIMHLFRTLCAPSKIIYIPIVEGLPSEAVTFPEKINAEPIISGLINDFKDDYAWTISGGGFRVKIKGREGLLGLMELDGLLFPEYKNHYLNLFLTIASAISLSISNSRLYQSLLIANNQLEKKTHELGQLNIHLEGQVRNKINEIRQKEQILIQQSKMATMGEMIGSIAHQWKQPLNAISVNIQDIKDAYEYGELNSEYIDNMIATSNEQVDFMAKTIDDFRNFFRPSKEKIAFNVVNSLKEVLSMFKDVFNKDSVTIGIFYDNGSELKCIGYPNEFKQVILNIINNSKDAIVVKRGKDPKAFFEGKIRITVHKEDHAVVVRVSDNGGGIPELIIERIFEPYFTTKPSDIGTGIGLYMSKTIIETNMAGSLTVRNIEEGAEFKIIIKAADG